MSKVSIIVPVYNTGLYLDKCLTSLVNQTLKDIEIIIVNDGSTDNSGDIIATYQKQYPGKIKIITQPNSGQGKARNVGIKQAKGEYLGFVDSDDWIELDMYEKMYNKAIKEKADIVLCDLKMVFDNYELVILGTDNNLQPKITSKQYFVSLAGPCNKIYKKELFDKYNINFLEGYIYEDLATIPLLGLYANAIYYFKEPLYNYYQRQNSIYNPTKYNPKLFHIFDVLEYLEKELKKRSFYNQYIVELEYIYIFNLLMASSYKFLPFPNANKNISSIIKLIKHRFPKWRQNKYYRQMDCSLKLFINLIYYKQLWLIKSFEKPFKKIVRHKYK